jgi:hypothetical protein
MGMCGEVFLQLRLCHAASCVGKLLWAGVAQTDAGLSPSASHGIRARATRVPLRKGRHTSKWIALGRE